LESESELKSAGERYVAGKGRTPSKADEEVVNDATKSYGLATQTRAGSNRLKQLTDFVNSNGVEAPRAILEALKDHDPGICRWAAEAAGERRLRAAVPDLVSLLSRSEQNFMYPRKSAARALGIIGDIESLEPLREAYSKEPVRGVKEAMGEAIEQLLKSQAQL
jgi:HEAT repeat protein